MGILSGIGKIFSSGASEIIDSIGNAIDKTTTSDEEKLTIMKDVKKIVADVTTRQLEHVEKEDSEVSSRWSSDMQSDNKLSKNIRPYSLIYTTSFTSILTLICLFVDISPEKLKALEPFVFLWTSIMVCQYTAYFGSRGFEKVKRMGLLTPIIEKSIKRTGITDECIKCGSKDVLPNQFYCKDCKK